MLRLYVKDILFSSDIATTKNPSTNPGRNTNPDFLRRKLEAVAVKVPKEFWKITPIPDLELQRDHLARNHRRVYTLGVWIFHPSYRHAGPYIFSRPKL
jgi:hypothetical protein